MTLLLWLAALPCLYWTAAVDSAPRVKAAGIERLCVPPERADDWRKAGFSAVALSEGDLAVRDTLLPPGIRARADRASATRSPWVDANGWRFLRDPAGQYAYDLPAGRAALAAAEAVVYGADAVLKIDPADLESLGDMLAFVAQLPANDLPAAADLAVVDDGSAPLGEVLNLLVRRNLLIRIVKVPSSDFGINVKLGTKEYPLKEAGEPSALALKIRRQLTDEQRALRVFGSEVVIGRLASDGSRARLHLLNYGGREIEGLRIHLRGSFPPGEALVAGQGRVALEERAVVDEATEFTVPRLGAYGVVDLPAVK
ncbi:MAG: hypothetical protein DMF83_26960 [Acidobacteria bacterium]|nr:MAG: hypothetical protein DMF83_26960 [Acidobacteriota bacterium]